MSFESTLESSALPVEIDASADMEEHHAKLQPMATQPILGELPLLQLPGDFLKTPATPYQPQPFKFSLPANLAVLLQAEAQTGSIEGKSWLLAALNVLLYRYTQQSAIAVDLTTLGESPAISLPPTLCTQVLAASRLRDLVAQVSAYLRDGRVRAAGNFTGERSAPAMASPVVVTFVRQAGKIPEPQQQWFTEFAQAQLASTHQPDWHLLIFQQETDSFGVLYYNAGLFQPATIERWMGHFQVLLEGMVSHMDCAIAQLPLLTAAELKQLLVDWGSPTIDYPALPIHRHIEAQAACQPEAIAVTFQQHHLTYGELNQRANQLATYLKQLGVGAETRVAVCVEPSWDIAIALLAIFKAGGVYVPLDPSHPMARLATILEEVQPAAVLTQSRLLPHLPRLRAWGGEVAPTLFCFDRDWAELPTAPASNVETQVNLDQTAYLIYTSGTTGKPKGVKVTHSNLVHYILVAQYQYGLNAQDVMPAIARFTFSISLFELLSPLVAGGRLLLLERDHILDFKRMTQTLEQITVLHASPSWLRRLLAYIDQGEAIPQTFPNLRHVSSGGDLVSADLLEGIKAAFEQAEVFVIYGCSEVSCMGCTFPVPRDQVVTKSYIGKPFPNVSVRLYDPNQNLVPVGVVGEIYIGGAGVAAGYLQRPELTQEKFIDLNGQRFYRTGDLGRLNPDGNLEILGRADFQIKLRGIRIELGEIETLLRQTPTVREAVVAARQLPGREETSLIAYVVPEHGQNLEIAKVRRRLQAKLPDYMVPAAFVLLESMPVNVNQKIDRRALPLPTAENLINVQTFVPASNPWEERLTEIWEALLGLQPIGIHDHFFEIGGDSLLAMNLMVEIEAAFGKTLPVSTIITAPTIAQLAAILNPDTVLPPPQSLVLLRSGGEAPPIFFVHDGEGETLLYRNLAHRLNPEHPVYGLQPLSREHYPMLHTRLTDMAAYYIEQIRKVQPEGPYFLAGLCVGGFLAFEMARQLRSQGQSTAMVALIDTADVEAKERPGRLVSARINRFSQSLGKGQNLTLRQRLLEVPAKVGRKLFNLIAYEVGSKFQKVKNRLKFKLLRYYLDRAAPAPGFLHNIPVRITLKLAEREYVPQAAYVGEVLLFRATEKSPLFDNTPIDDTPYTEIYSDPLLGWEKRVTHGVVVHDVPGGHSSMLQEPNVQVLADLMQAYIDNALEATQLTSDLAPYSVIQLTEAGPAPGVGVS
jgi:amino acid adenylation domain-containing protein